MKLKFDVTAEEFKIIQTILNQYLPTNCKVWVFGSRAKNTARHNSDLDLALDYTEKLNSQIISKLKEAFNEAPLAFSIDIVDLLGIEDYFREIIEQQKVVFPLSSRVPELRFSEFKGTWNLTTLGDTTKYTKGFAFKSGDYRNEGKRIVRVSDLDRDHIKKQNEKVFISIDQTHLYDKYEIKKGNIIITTVGSKPEMLDSAVGRGIYVSNNNEGLLNQNLLKFENLEEVNNKFLSCYINSPKYINHIISIQRGNANQSNITVKNLLEFKVAIPNLKEQQKIADFLTSVDKKISLLTEKQSLLQHYKKGVMQKLFSQELRFQDDQGNDFPDWEEKELCVIANKVSAKNKDESIVSVLTNSAREGIVSQTDYFDKDIANKNNLGGYYIVETNDFVYNPRISTLAPVGPIKRNHLEKGVMSPLYSVFRFKQDDYLTFYEFYFATTKWHHYMNSIANFGARHDRMNITMNDFFKLPLPYPSIEEMEKIVLFIKDIEKKLNFVTLQLEQTKTFKKGLLQKMFV